MADDALNAGDNMDKIDPDLVPIKMTTELATQVVFAFKHIPIKSASESALYEKAIEVLMIYFKTCIVCSKVTPL